MVEKSNSRQHQILEILLENKNGMAIEQLAAKLAISRAAVQQHFTVLERDGLIKKTQMHKTGGRPVSLYALSDKGINYFPKQYAWLTEIILDNLIDEIDADRLRSYLQKLGTRMAEKLRGRFTDKNSEERIAELVLVMNELGFKVNAVNRETGGLSALQAFNCVYHDLAQKNEIVCEFDVALISTCLGRTIVHENCMARGDCFCKFTVVDKPVGE